MGGCGFPSALIIIRQSQPSLAGDWAGPELGKNSSYVCPLAVNSVAEAGRMAELQHTNRLGKTFLVGWWMKKLRIRQLDVLGIIFLGA